MIGDNLGFLVGLLALLMVMLALLLHAQIAQRRALSRWLVKPESEIPDGRGPWREVFSLLQRREKEASRDMARLVRSLDHFRLATQALPDGVILLDDQTHIDWMNAAAIQHFGLDPRRDAGTLVGQLIRQGEFHAYLSAFREYRGESEPL